jgi:hypothetical protein
MRRIATIGLAIGIAALVVSPQTSRLAAQRDNDPVEIDADDIGGVVTGPSGPEAGVWVIAETTELPTKFARIVVTDERGRYAVPDLPRAAYDVWVRGYGLIDSPRVTASPGHQLNLTAVVAPTSAAAARIYPANYWYSMLRFPIEKDFPGTGPAGNGIPTSFATHHDWITSNKGCLNCHQMGNEPTRLIPKELGVFDSTIGAWDHRVKVGQTGVSMSASVTRLGRQRTLAMYAEWTDRIMAGELPSTAPARPTGVERNIVVSMWDWGETPLEFVHDAIATDKRNPTVNAFGNYYGVGSGQDNLIWINPKDHTAHSVKFPTANPTITGPLGAKSIVLSPYHKEARYWNNPAYPHNPMMGSDGRVWATAAIRSPAKPPEFCGAESTNKFTRYFPARSTKQLAVFNPATKQFEMIDLCFGTHHLYFGFDRDNTLFFSSASGFDVVGWFNTRVYDETKSVERAQGWCPAVLDTNGDGKITRPWTEPNEPVDPTKDHRVQVPSYGNAINPVDGSAWYASTPAITRLEIGSNPPETCRAERYEAPPGTAFYPHGIDFDKNGVAWVNFPASGHLASFDRRKCKVLTGPIATGQHCREGWTFYKLPGPLLSGLQVDADWTYLTWVDQFNTFGLGENIPMTQGVNGDVIYALLPQTGQWVLIRVPYPLNFYARSHDGRIDDSRAGWKGRGLWTNYASTNNWHIEGGNGTRSKAVQIQLRPNPLAK